MPKFITLRLKSDTELRALIRGKPVRPAQQHKDRKLEAKRKACRGKGWDD
jgi:hypothetical protein